MSSEMTKDEIYNRLREVLSESFDIEPSRVVPEAHLFTDLDLDSIDAVELAIQLQSFTKRRVKAEEFKGVRTVNDVVEVVHEMLASQ